MGKIKLNLPTGVSVDKSLINSFKVENITYAVFDADSVGSMGLPIILVSKYDNNRLVKIVEADEWTKVKGYLKEIISGVKKEFVQLDSSLEADEIFYTQLTLPLASFDSLKKVYDEFVASSSSNNVNEVVTSTPEMVNDLPNVNVETNNISNAVDNVVGIVDNSPVVANQSVPETDNGIKENIISQPIDNNLETSTIASPANEGNIVPELNNVPVSNDALIQPNSEIINNDLNIISQDVVSNPVQNNATNTNTNTDAVANPLIEDNVLPNLEVQTPEKVVEASIPNPTENVVSELQVIPSVTNNEVSAQNEGEVQNNNEVLETPVVETSQVQKVNLDAEKEEFLKLCGDLFDKIIEKIKNN